jgi:putative flippase GtrA
MKFSERQEFRFLVAGAINTSLGYALFLLLNLGLDYRIAYSLSFAFGIVLSFVLNSLYVFRQPLRWRRLAAYPVVYLLQYFVGMACVWFFVGVLDQPESLAPIPAIAITLPATYFLSRYILREHRDATANR